MAARSSGSGGAMILAVITTILALVFGVTTIIFFSQLNKREQEIAQRDETDSEFITSAERQQDDVRRIRQAAGRDSVVGYLLSAHADALRYAGVSDQDELLALFDNDAPGGKKVQATSLLREVDRLGNEVEGLERQLATAQQAADNARRAQRDEVQRVAEIETSLRDALAAAQSELSEYREGVDQYSDDVSAARQRMDEQIESVRNDARDREAELNNEIDKLERELLLATDTAKRLQEELRGQRYQGEAEEALVDGHVISTDPSGDVVFISIGRRDKAVLGMPFELYSEPSALRPDPETGNYPEGKASIEIIEVGESSSKCRVLRSRRGDPVAKGDVIANAVYDPNKVYTALVYGNFDANADGRYTEQEQRDIRAKIEAWGGRTVDELTGSVDFLVMGRRPEPGPPPNIDAPIVVMEEHIRKTRIAKRYDELLQQAVATSIPVLNENRLETLTGGFGN